MSEWDWVNKDKGSFGKEGGSMPSSELIPLRGKNFASMRDASQIDSMKAAAPSFHREAEAKFRIQSEMAIPRSNSLSNSLSQVKRITAQQGFKRGSAVVHKETGKKYTIIAASVGYTTKTQTPVHKVADKEGNVCNVKESKLKLRV